MPKLKIKVKAARFFTAWRWDIPENEVCGICRIEFERCCPACKIPGDDCPPVWGACSHTFHMHCIMKWLEAQKDKEPECPLCRRPWEFRAEEAPPGAEATAAGGAAGAAAVAGAS